MATRDHIAEQLREISREQGLSGAAVGRLLGMQRSMGAALLRGGTLTTVEHLETWARHVGRGIVMELIPLTIRATTKDLLAVVARMEPRTAARILRFARVQGVADDTRLAVWDAGLEILEAKRRGQRPMLRE